MDWAARRVRRLAGRGGVFFWTPWKCRPLNDKQAAPRDAQKAYNNFLVIDKPDPDAFLPMYSLHSRTMLEWDCDGDLTKPETGILKGFKGPGPVCFTPTVDWLLCRNISLICLLVAAMRWCLVHLRTGNQTGNYTTSPQMVTPFCPLTTPLPFGWIEGVGQT